MDRIEDVLKTGCRFGYADGSSLPAPYEVQSVCGRLLDAWAVWRGRAVAIQWPHHRHRASTPPWVAAGLPSEPSRKTDEAEPPLDSHALGDLDLLKKPAR